MKADGCRRSRRWPAGKKEARKIDVIRLMLVDAIRMAALGIGAGIWIALALAAGLRTYLFGIGPADLGTLLCMTTLLVLVILATAWLPAWRAARTDPLAAFRAD